MEETLLAAIPRVLGDTLDKAKKYVAAVSGGADSLALADALWQNGFDFTVCHVEHGIRGAESLEDAAFVEAFCEQRGIPFCCKYVRVPEFREKEKLSLEDAARRLRYQALFQCADETGADFILTAHQKDDQAETFLLRLLRGSGTRGLGAIRFRRGRVLRPLLSFSGEELRSYCTQRGIRWRDDATNEDTSYARNRVRKVLLPLLKEEFSPAITEILCRTAEHLQEDACYLEEAAAEELQKRIRFLQGSDCPALGTDGWERVPRVLRYRILRRFWQSAGGRKELSSVNIGDMDRLIEKGHSGKKILLPDSWQGLYSYDKLILFSPERLRGLHDGADRRLAICLERLLHGTGENGEAGLEIPFPDGRTAGLFIRKEKPAFVYRTQMIYPAESLRKLGSVLEFRHRRPGDRILPLKGTGHKSLKKYLIERKIPVEERDRLVVAAVENEIIWIPGIANARWDPEDVTDSRPQDWLFMSLTE